MIYYTNLDKNDPFAQAMNSVACESFLSLLDDLGFDATAHGFASGHNLFDPTSQPGTIDAATAHAWSKAIDAALDEDLIIDVVHAGEWGIVEAGALRLAGPQVRDPFPNGSEIRGLDDDTRDWLQDLIDFLDMSDGFTWQ